MPVILDNQQVVDAPINVALMEIIDFLDRPDLQGLAIKHKSPFKHLLDEQDINNGNTNNGLGGNPQQSA